MWCCASTHRRVPLQSVSLYLIDVSRGSYDDDDRHILSEFIDVLDNLSPNTTLKEVQLPLEIDEPDMNLCNGDLNALYIVCGYIIYCHIENRCYVDGAHRGLVVDEKLTRPLTAVVIMTAAWTMSRY